jgi:hypothetical protein
MVNLKTKIIFYVNNHHDIIELASWKKGEEGMDAFGAED